MIEKLISKIGIDKFAHFGMGGIISAVFTLAIIIQYDYTGISCLLTVLLTIPIVFLIAFFKEVLDMKTTGLSWYDILATMLGIIPILVSVLLGILFNHLAG